MSSIFKSSFLSNVSYGDPIDKKKSIDPMNRIRTKFKDYLNNQLEIVSGTIKDPSYVDPNGKAPCFKLDDGVWDVDFRYGKKRVTFDGKKNWKFKTIEEVKRSFEELIGELEAHNPALDKRLFEIVSVRSKESSSGSEETPALPAEPPHKGAGSKGPKTRT